MAEFLSSSVFFAVLLTLASFELGRALQKKWKSPLLNPILIGALLSGTVLVLFRIPVADYKKNCEPLQFLLTPATICYAVGLYEQIGKLKKHLPAILLGVFCGTLTSLLCVKLMCILFGLNAALTSTLLPKSITTAIGIVLSEEAGGIPGLTAAVIVLTGILGNLFGPTMCRLFGIKDEIAQGAAFGTASHAVGTAKAIELSEITGAVSSLSLTFAGLFTVVLFSFFTM